MLTQHRRIGLILFGLAMVVYGATLYPGAFPGESAKLIVQ